MSVPHVPRAGLLDQCNALAAHGIPWRIVLPADSPRRKRAIGYVYGAWYLMPDGSWSVRQFQAAVAAGEIEPYPQHP